MKPVQSITDYLNISDKDLEYEMNPFAWAEVAYVVLDGIRYTVKLEE